MDIFFKSILELDISFWGSIASIIALFLAIFVGNKIYNIIKIGKLELDNSTEKQENKSWFSFFNIQINKKEK